MQVDEYGVVFAGALWQPLPDLRELLLSNCHINSVPLHDALLLSTLLVIPSTLQPLHQLGASHCTLYFILYTVYHILSN